MLNPKHRPTHTHHRDHEPTRIIKTNFVVGVLSEAQKQMRAEGEDKWRLGGGGEHALRQV